MHRHYEKAADGNVDVEALKSEFKAAEKEGKNAYKENKAAIAEKEAVAKAKLDELNVELKAGRLSQTEYEERASRI